MWQDGDVPAQYRVWRREDGSPWRLGGGTACKATDLRTDEAVALRFFEAPVSGPADAAALARLGQRLSRPGSGRVAALRDLFIREKAHLAAAEFVEGESLAERVRRQGALPPETAWAVARETLLALAALHETGVAHGSFGPTKVLFPAAGGPLKIVDGGLYAGAGSLAPAAGSPETAADLRRLGMTIWLALTGSLPFAEGLLAPASTPLRWQPLDTVPASVTLRALVALFARTLTGASGRRPQTAGTLSRSLEAQGFRPGMIDEEAAVPAGGREAAGAAGPLPDEPPAGISAALEVALASRGTDLAGNHLPSGSRPPPARPRRRRKGSFWKIDLSLAVFVVSGAAAVLALRRPPVAEVKLSKAKAAPVNQVRPVPEATAAASDEPAVTPWQESPPVSGDGIQARALRIQTLQPETLEALKPARELRRVATVPVVPGQPFPGAAEVARLGARLFPASPNARRTGLVLVLGCADGASAAGSVTGAQEEADALAAALTQYGVTAPIYACGLGPPDGMPEVDRAAAGEGDFVEVWVAYFLF